MPQPPHCLVSCLPGLSPTDSHPPRLRSSICCLPASMSRRAWFLRFLLLATLLAGGQPQVTQKSLQSHWEDVNVPQPFLAVSGGKKKKAVAMYRQMLRWRKENEIDTMLERPYPIWHAIKKLYPHAVHCRGRQGEIVTIEMPGKMDMPAMKRAGITPTVMGLHRAFFFEYAFQRIDPREGIQSIVIMDCTSLSLVMAASVDSLGLIKGVCDVIAQFYPQRAHKILAVNPPMFFGPVFNLIKSVLPHGMSQVVECVSLTELHRYVDPAVLPPQLGGTSSVVVGEAESEKDFADFVARLNGPTAFF